MNKCIFCGNESEDVVFTENQHGWFYSCQDILSCHKRISQNLVAKNIVEYHKGEACKNKPETLCVEGHCVKCELDKS